VCVRVTFTLMPYLSQPTETSAESMLLRAEQLLEQAKSTQKWQSDRLKKEAAVLVASTGRVKEARSIAEQIGYDFIRTRALVAIAAEQFKDTGELPEEIAFSHAQDGVVLARALAERDIARAESLLLQLLVWYLRREEQEEQGVLDTFAPDFASLAEGFARIGLEELAEYVFAYAYKLLLEKDFDLRQDLMREEMIPRLECLEPRLLLPIMQQCLATARQRGRAVTLECISDFFLLLRHSLDASIIREIIQMGEAIEAWWKHEDRFASLRV